MNPVTVRPVADGADLRAFIRFPWRIYREHAPDPNWVPPLISSEKKQFDKQSFPFFEHGDAGFFLAEESGRTVGRIAAIANDNHVSFHEEEVGFFGFFESFRDETISLALIEAASEWVSERGLKAIRGPVNYSTNESCGLLVEGFEEPPTILMPHNPPYYADILKRAGLLEVRELLSYVITQDAGVDRFVRIAAEARRRAEIEFKPLRMDHYEEDVALIKEVYNDAWERNWGFVPMTDAEIDHMAAQMKQVVDPDFIKLAFVRGEVAGFVLTLPDANQILLNMNGRLLPFGWLKLLTGLKKIDRARVLALGVKKKFQRMGLGSLFYADAVDVGIRKGYREGEASWILADNTQMRKPIEEMGGRINKRYMIYEKSL